MNVNMNINILDMNTDDFRYNHMNMNTDNFK
jgi:hypothetical protein